MNVTSPQPHSASLTFGRVSQPARPALHARLLSALLLFVCMLCVAGATAQAGDLPLRAQFMRMLQPAMPAVPADRAEEGPAEEFELAESGPLQKLHGQLQMAFEANGEQRGVQGIREHSGLPADLFNGTDVLVEIYYSQSGVARGASPSAARVQDVLQSIGARVTGRLGNAAVVAWVPLGRLDALAAEDGVARVSLARKVKFLGAETSQGLTLANGDWWQSPGGFTGSGITVALIDGFSNTGIAGLQGSGDWPPDARLTRHDFKTNGTPCVGFGCANESHGNATMELIHDYVPDATFIAYDTWYVSEWYAAILHAANLGDGTGGTTLGQPLGAPRANVISVSLGAPLDSIGDGTAIPGSIAEAASFARANGVVIVNAAGNGADSHWGGLIDPATGTNARYHRWGTANNNNTFNNLFDGYCVPAGFSIALSLSWDNWRIVNGSFAANQDYALRLYYRNPTGTGYTQAAVSDFQQNGSAGNTPQEFLNYTTTNGTSNGCNSGYRSYWVRIERKAGTTSSNYLHFFEEVGYGLIQRGTIPASLGYPADSPNLITVGAIDYMTPAAIESFSGRGPVLGAGGAAPSPNNPATDTNVKPDVSQYDFVNTLSYGANGFGGTSAATPQVAGMVAQIMQNYGVPANAADVDDIKDIVHSIALTGANDLGTTGRDYSFGWGVLRFQKEAALEFVQQPSNTYANDVITPNVAVGVRDGAGQLVRYGIFQNIALAIGTNPPGIGVLSQTAAPISSAPINGVIGGGVATFDTASIDQAGVGYTLAASAGALSATSSAFDILLHAVDGVCGDAHGGTFISAPTSDLCDAGLPTTVSGSGPWTWMCQGIAGGANSPQCSANIQTYTVTFVDWDATVLRTEQVDHGGAATAPADPSRTGYTFAGWDVAFSNVTADLTVTAQYTINQYTVTFVDWDATVLRTEQVNHGGAATAPADPSRTGYTFAGWDVAFSNVTADLTVTAQYTINQYTVTFVDWDATVLRTEQVNHGGAATAPADPSRTG
ncbi:MAG TPA: InlB B-repeat-containing protein, partial [Chiayiivirga sp.]|nr:InlB B-repeat-containing protein [Chiayiivirga sp.]